MIRVSASFTDFRDIEIEVLIRAPYSDWRELLELIDGDKYPGSMFHQYIKEALNKLERQVNVIGDK